MKVDVSTNSPILRMEVDTDDFGKLFSSMADNEQVSVLRSIVSHMRLHPTQWDYIAIQLEKEENKDLVRDLFYIIRGMGLVK